MKRNLLLTLLGISTLILCTSCEDSSLKQDVSRTIEAGSTLTKNQPSPTDIEYSLERYNLIRRAYWVNGEKEKARAVTRPAEVPMGYCVLFNYGQVIGQFMVDGKVTSLNSFLTEDYYYSTNGRQYAMPDIDGSFGSNDDGVFFFTPEWQYIEWTGEYLYSDTPFKVSKTVLEDY